MKKVLVVKASEIKVKAFALDDFTQDKETDGTMKKVSKKELRTLADNLGLIYEDADIIFTKKMMIAYLKKIK